MKKKTYYPKPVKVNFTGKDGKFIGFNATRCTYPQVELKGEPIESFERVEEIAEVILLGVNGGVRRIVFK